ncbi:MAG: alpha/beta hydrolase [Salinivirgaceae bacterium]
MDGEFLNPKKIAIECYSINYYDLGEGEAILLLHGITTYSFIWRNIAPLLSTKYRVIVPDLLGCGDSDKPLDIPYSLTNHANIMAKFIKALGIERYHLVGHDLGGGISQIIAVNYKSNIIDLTLINSVAYDFWPVQPIIAMRTPVIRQMAMATLDFGTFKLIVQRGLYNKSKCDEPLMKYYFKPMQTTEGRKAFLHFAHCLDNKNLTDITNKLHNLDVPVLIIRGEHDVYLSSKIADLLHENIKGSKLILFEKGGHFIQEDAPEFIVEALTLFFTEEHT